jgi:hypothetical protein
MLNSTVQIRPLAAEQFGRPVTVVWCLPPSRIYGQGTDRGTERDETQIGLLNVPVREVSIR